MVVPNRQLSGKLDEFDVIAVLGTATGNEQVNGGRLAGVAAHEVSVDIDLAEVLEADGSHQLQFDRHSGSHQPGRFFRGY
jgi:hypothetical protein